MRRAGSPEAHFIVVLNVDVPGNEVWYQSFSSQIQHVIQLPGEPAPHIDVDATAFINFRKYSFLDKETFVPMWYGVTKENKIAFEDGIRNGLYKLEGKIIDHNRKYLVQVLKCATEESRLSEYDRKMIASYYFATGNIP